MHFGIFFPRFALRSIDFRLVLTCHRSPTNPHTLSNPFMWTATWRPTVIVNSDGRGRSERKIKRGEAFDWFIRHVEVGQTTSSQRAQHISSPSTSEEVDTTCLLETRRKSYERLFSSIGELRHEQRLRWLHVGRYVSDYVAQRAQPELWTEWTRNVAPVSHSPKIRRERQVEQASKVHPTTDAPSMMRFLWQIRDGLANPRNQS